MSKRSPSFIKNKWVGAASQITRRTFRETTFDDPNGLGTIRESPQRRNGNATPPEWREFSREMIDVLREIQGQTDGIQPLFHSTVNLILTVSKEKLFRQASFFYVKNCWRRLPLSTVSLSEAGQTRHSR